MNIQDAIFDMDSTLVDSLMIWNMIWEKFRDGSFRLSQESNKAIRTMILRDAWEN